jgi:hypothetical protein
MNDMGFKIGAECLGDCPAVIIATAKTNFYGKRIWGLLR